MTSATDDLADIAGWRMGLDATMKSMLRLAKLMPLDRAGQVETAAQRVEQAIDELDRAASELREEVNRIECKLERKHERESAPITV